MDELIKKVQKILTNPGHSIDHTLRVYNLAIEFAKKENANLHIVGISALLHDVDDYKFSSKEDALNLTNSKRIMEEMNYSNEVVHVVLDILRSIGYKNRLDNIYPKTLEGMIVSDADMCDALGKNGIERAIEYSKHKGIEFFNPKIFPDLSMDGNKYSQKNTTTINHFFEKLLKLKDLMLTQSGKNYSITLHKELIEFLDNYFKKINNQEWINYLNEYLSNISK